MGHGDCIKILGPYLVSCRYDRSPSGRRKFENCVWEMIMKVRFHFTFGSREWLESASLYRNFTHFDAFSSMQEEV